MIDPRDRPLVEREYATLDRVAHRRLDRTGWLRDAGQPLETLLGAIAEVRPHRVLDAGCGNGEITALVAAPEVVGVDQSDVAVGAAVGRGLRAVRADIERLEFDDGSFDVVMCNWVLYHLEDLDRGLSELARVLQPGGRFVGIYNLAGHLDEVWLRVGKRWPADAFNGENGSTALARHFAAVERRDTQGEVLWENRAALQSYLDSYVELMGALEAPASPYPFRATRRNCVFVATAAS